MPEDVKPEEIPPDSKIGKLVAKIVERNREIEKTKQALQDIYREEADNIKHKMNQMGLEELGLYNF